MTADWIDSHVHVWAPDRLRYPRVADSAEPAPASFTPEDLLAIARPAGVKRAVLVQVGFYGADNRYLADAIQRFPGVFSGIPVLDPESKDAPLELEKGAAAGMRGFRIPARIHASGWMASEGMKKMWSRAAACRLPVSVLLNPDALPAAGRMCAHFPETPVVIDHMGRIGMDGRIREEDVQALCRLAAQPRTHVKVSAFYALGRKQARYLDLVPLVKRIFEAFGSRRLLWGSDAPGQLLHGHGYADSLEFVREELDFLSKEDLSWLLGRTAERLFFSGAPE